MWTFLLLVLALVAPSHQNAPAPAFAKLCDKAFLLNAYNAPTYYAETDGLHVLKLQSNTNGTRFREVPALNGDATAVSFEAVSDSGHYIVNTDAIISVKKNDNSAAFKSESSFKISAGPEGYYRLSSAIHPTHFIRHQNFVMKLHKWSETDLFKNDTLFRFMCTSDRSNQLDICDGDFELQSQNYPAYEVTAEAGKVVVISKTQNGTNFKFVNPALNGNMKHVSIVSVEHPGFYLTSTADHLIELTKLENTAAYKASASFRVVSLKGGLIRFQSAANPRHYIRHSSYRLRVDGWSDTELYRQDSAWKIECTITPCATRHWVYNKDYEVAKGPDCVFAPAKWWQFDPACHDVAANRPSPINIETALCKTKDASLKPIRLGAGWHDERKFNIVNNGHSIQANVKDAKDLTVDGGHLNGTFEVIQFHFHWGSKANMADGNGSEHKLFDQTGKREHTPLEVHIVCIKKGMTAAQAVKVPDAVAVLGGFIRALTPKEHDGWVAHILAQIFADLNEIKTPLAHGAKAHKAVEMEIQLRDLLPENLNYINYDGAFTTPTCNSVAQWHIFPSVMHVHADLLNDFTKVFFDAEKKRPMVDNFRPVQGRHGRPLRCSFAAGTAKSLS